MAVKTPLTNREKTIWEEAMLDKLKEALAAGCANIVAVLLTGRKDNIIGPREFGQAELWLIEAAKKGYATTITILLKAISYPG